MVAKGDFWCFANPQTPDFCRGCAPGPALAEGSITPLQGPVLFPFCVVVLCAVQLCCLRLPCRCVICNWVGSGSTHV
jgi:hypothetical protein